MTAEAKIRISTDGAQALGVLKRVREEFKQIGSDGAKSIDAVDAEWKAAVDRIGAGLNKVSAVKTELSSIGTLKPFAGVTQQATQAEGALRATAAAAKSLVAAMAGVEGARLVVQNTDAYTGLTGRLKVATSSQEEYNRALGDAQAIARIYNQDLSATASSYTRVLSAVKPLNGSVREARIVVEATSAALKISGATAEEAASAQLQLSQALGKGVLNGEEFNAINEAAPNLLRALAQGLGVPTAALKEMGAQGQLTTAKIIEGLRNALPELQAQAAAIPVTLQGAAQAARNALLVYIGESEDARAATRLLGQTLSGIAANIGPIVNAVTVLATLIGVTYVGRLAAGAAASTAFAAQQLVLAAAARSAAAEMGMAAAASTSLTAAIGGPVGLVVALAALAAGWVAVSRAKSQAAKDAETLDDVKAERAAVQAELDRLNQRRTNLGALEAADERGYLKRKLNRLDEEIADRERRKLDAQIMAGGPRGATTKEQMLDPGTVQAIEQEFKTRESIEKSFLDKRRAYTLAKDAEIAQARERGAAGYAEQLETQKNAVLARLDQERVRAVQALDRDTQVNRLAQARATFDKEAALQVDALQRQADASRQAYEQGLTSYKTYLADKAAADDAARSADLANLRAQLAEQNRVLSLNRAARDRASTANERVAADDAIARQLETIARLEADIERRKRDQVAAAAARRREEAQIVDDLRRQRQEIDAMLIKATGSETPETVASDVRRRYEAQLQSVLQNDQNPEPLLKLIDVEVERAKFELLLRQFQERRDALDIAEQGVRAELGAGLITESEAEARVLQLRRDSLQALRDASAALGDQSRKLDEVAGKTQPKEAAQAKSADTNVKQISELNTELEKTARSSGMSAISSELSNIFSGSKKATEGLRDMVSNFAQSMLDLISKKLGEQLIDSLFGGAGGPGAAGGGGLLGSAATLIASFFHGGGVVGTGGGSRSLPASTWAMAPRYHSGGVAGLSRNEVPAVLMAGEEVLTADDPRHVNNLSRSIGGVQVNNSVSISGAGGTDSDQAGAAQDLLGMINSAIDAWAIKQARPGGMLSGAR